MSNKVFTGLTAGLVAAVLYVTVGTGTLFALLLFYLAPLPLFIAGLGWGTVAAVIGSALGGLLVTLVSGVETGMLFMVTVALPVVILTYLVLLNRTVTVDGTETVDWYPIGRLLIWIAVLSTALVGFAVILLGPSEAAFEAAIREWFTAVLNVHQEVRDQLTRSGTADINKTVEFLVWALPLASATLWMLTTVMNIWLASVVVERSGTSIRPRTPLSHLDLPASVVIALAAAAALSLVQGAIGIIASSLAAVLAVCFILQGLAVIHVLSRPSPYRRMILGMTYVLLFLGSWPGASVILVIGIAEATLRLRDRFADRGGPPSPNLST